jgi:hypothetical protein
MPKKARRWMRVDSEGWPVDAEQLASQLRFNPEFAQKVADETKPGNNRGYYGSACRAETEI